MPTPRPVFLLTDFGLSDPYVGLMRAAICAHRPDLPIHDLSHGVPPQQIRVGALWLASSAPWLPDDAVVVAVVDPGVGSARRPAARRVGDRIFVGPDNGLLSLVPPVETVVTFVEPYVAMLGAPATEDWRLLAPPGLPPPASRTFHGRDLFAPAAARLASGALRFEDAGPILPEPVRLDPPEITQLPDGSILGEVLYLDHYGNAVLSLPAADAGRVALPGAAPGAEVTLPVLLRYADAAPGQALALTGSTGRLEISVRDGSAAARYPLHPGTPVRWLP